MSLLDFIIAYEAGLITATGEITGLGQQTIDESEKS